MNRTAAHEPRIARVAAMIADPARSLMLAYLLSGEFASAGELAAAASVKPATASGHLAGELGDVLVVPITQGGDFARYARPRYPPSDADTVTAPPLLSFSPAQSTTTSSPGKVPFR